MSSEERLVSLLEETRRLSRQATAATGGLRREALRELEQTAETALRRIRDAQRHNYTLRQEEVRQHIQDMLDAAPELLRSPYPAPGEPRDVPTEEELARGPHPDGYERARLAQEDLASDIADWPSPGPQDDDVYVDRDYFPGPDEPKPEPEPPPKRGRRLML